MQSNREYFQQIFGIIMGTNLAPILANLYLAMFQEELKKKCVHDKKLNGQFSSKDSLMMVWHHKWKKTRRRILGKSIQHPTENNKNR
jgi:hypothetical protein